MSRKSNAHLANHAGSDVDQTSVTLERSSQHSRKGSASQNANINKSDSADTSEDSHQEARMKKTKDMVVSYDDEQECTSKRNEKEDLDKTFNACKESGSGSRKRTWRLKISELKPVTSSGNAEEECSNKRRKKSSGCRDNSNIQVQELEKNLNEKDGQSPDKIDEVGSTQEYDEVHDRQDIIFIDGMSLKNVKVKEEHCAARAKDGQYVETRLADVRFTRKSESQRTRATPPSVLEQGKETRRQQIDESLADENQINKVSESPSTSSKPSSIVPKTIFNAQAFKEMLESRECNSKRRVQAIKKSVTKVATGLVNCDGIEGGTSLVKRKCTEVLNDTTQEACSDRVAAPLNNNSNNNSSEDNDTSSSSASIDIYHEDNDRIYPIIDILQDSVLYYDSKSASSGGLIKESYLSSCQLFMPMITPTRYTDRVATANETALEEGEDKHTQVEKGQELDEQFLEVDTNSKEEQMISKERVGHKEKTSTEQQNVQDAKAADDLLTVTNDQMEQAGWLSPRKKKKKNKKKCRETFSHGESIAAESCDESTLSQSPVKRTSSNNNISKFRKELNAEDCSDEDKVKEFTEHSLTRERKNKGNVKNIDEQANDKDSEIFTDKEEFTHERFASKDPFTDCSMTLPPKITSPDENVTKDKSAKQQKRNSSMNKDISEQTLPGNSPDVTAAVELQARGQSAVDAPGDDIKQESFTEEKNEEKKMKKKKKKKKEKKKKEKYKERDKADAFAEETCEEKDRKERLENIQGCDVDKGKMFSVEDNCDEKKKKKKKEKKKRREKRAESEDDVDEEETSRTKKSGQTGQISRKEEPKAAIKPVLQINEEIPKKKRKRKRQECEETATSSQKGSYPDSGMFSSCSEAEGNIPLTNVLSWISKTEIKPQTTEKSSTKKASKSSLMDLAQDDPELRRQKTPLHSSRPCFTSRSSSLSSSSRIFHKTPLGFTNTVPRTHEKATFLRTPVACNRRKRMLSTSLPRRRELTQEEKDIFSGGIKRLEELLYNDSVWD